MVEVGSVGSVGRTIATRIRIARHIAGLTHSELAERAGVAKSNIWELEQGGNPTVATLELVAGALKRPVEWFLSSAAVCPLCGQQLPEGSEVPLV